jgi:hypothetical protein
VAGNHTIFSAHGILAKHRTCGLTPSALTHASKIFCDVSDCRKDPPFHDDLAPYYVAQNAKAKGAVFILHDGNAAATELQKPLHRPGRL